MWCQGVFCSPYPFVKRSIFDKVSVWNQLVLLSSSSAVWKIVKPLIVCTGSILLLIVYLPKDNLLDYENQYLLKNRMLLYWWPIFSDTWNFESKCFSQQRQFVCCNLFSWNIFSDRDLFLMEQNTTTRIHWSFSHYERDNRLIGCERNQRKWVSKGFLSTVMLHVLWVSCGFGYFNPQYFA